MLTFTFQPIFEQMKSKKTLFTILFIFVLFANVFSQNNYWTKANSQDINSLKKDSRESIADNLIYFSLDLNSFTYKLLSSQNYGNKNEFIIIILPNVDGKLESYKIVESSNFSPELQTQFPFIRAYSGIGINDPSASLRLSLSTSGIQTMVLRADKQTEFIEQVSKESSIYNVFNSASRAKGELPYNCSTKDEKVIIDTFNKTTASNTQTLKKFRLALSCTGEYTAYHGGTVSGALAAMNATLTRVNGIFERDLAIKLELIASNTSIIYTNATTDPYSNADLGSGGDWSLELQNNLTATIGNNAYDIGHLFGASGGGGNAGCIGCICVNPTTQDPEGKGSAFTSPPNDRPEGDTFDIDYVVHEFGHQLGANHTFSHTFEGSGVQVEPGSGSTIMGYAGITNYNVQSNSDDYFTYRSILQIQQNLATKTCQTDAALSNTPPIISAGLDFTIPIGTAFVLTGSGSDTNGQALSYTWEQNDNSSSTTTSGNSIGFPTKASGPNFRSVKPSVIPTRYFPSLSNILNNDLFSAYESVSNVARTFNFVLTGRDNVTGGGQTNSDATIINVNSAAGPFEITSQNTEELIWNSGTSQTITWSVNNTTSLSGSANVDILLSTDNGQTYNTVLASATPNDGSHTITVPNLPAPFCRVMVKPTENVYFDINAKNFSIDYTITNTCKTYTNNTATPIPDGVTSFSTATINVNDNDIIKSITVNVNITHPYVGDISLAILSPQNNEVNLLSGKCNSNDDLDITFSDNGSVLQCTTPKVVGLFLPEEALSKYTNEGSNGTWTLGFSDNAADDKGTLNSWSITVCSQIITPITSQEFDFKSIKIYPNPTKSKLRIEVPNVNSLPNNIVIYNSLGQIITDKNINVTSDLEIDVSNLAQGIYFLKINKEGASKVLRFIKE